MLRAALISRRFSESVLARVRCPLFKSFSSRNPPTASSPFSSPHRIQTGGALHEGRSSRSPIPVKVDPWSLERCHCKSQHKNKTSASVSSGFSWPSLSDYVFALLGLRALATLVTVSTYFYFTHLHETPITGRRRFIFLGDETMRYLSQRRFAEETGQVFLKTQMITSAGEEHSDHHHHSSSDGCGCVGSSAEQAQLPQHLLPMDHPFVQFVHDIGMDLVKASRLHDVDWRFFVVDDAENMARCLPDGTVFIHAGLLKAADSVDSVAGVMGHEMAHVVARHGAEKISSKLFLPTLSILCCSFAGASLKLLCVALSSSALYISSRERIREYEADYIGLQLTAAAGYDPRGLAQYFEKLIKEDEERGTHEKHLETLSTHPSRRKRVERLMSHMPAAYELYSRYQPDPDCCHTVMIGNQKVTFGPSRHKEAMAQRSDADSSQSAPHASGKS